MRHRPEEQQRLINEVTAEVVEYATCFLRIGPLSPSLFRGRSPALESRLEA
jgi:hypothetical protein